MEDTFINPKEDDKGGEIARKGFLRQDLFLINELIKVIRNDKFLCAYCEHHEDYILVYEGLVKVVQVKTKNDNVAEWSLDKKFCEEVVKQFYDASKKINTSKTVEYYFVTNCQLKPKLVKFFKILKKSEKNCTPEEITEVDNFVASIIKWLKLDEVEKPKVREILWTIFYENKDSHEAMLRGDKALIQEVMKPFKIDIDIAEKIHQQLILMASLAASEAQDVGIENTFSILSDTTLCFEDRQAKLTQLKKCITRKKILQSITIEGNPFDSDVMYKYPENQMKFQRMMLESGIPSVLVNQAGLEFFNIDYHRKRLNGMLGELGMRYLDGTKAEISSKWSTVYGDNLEMQDNFGNTVYNQTRKKIVDGVAKNELTSPVMKKEIHAFGLLHELAEDEKITYAKEVK